MEVLKSVGRPSKFKEEFVQIAKKLCELGATDNDVAEALGINVATLYRWRHEYPSFCESLKVGKEVADDRVEMSLYKKAVGYRQESVKILQYQGEPLIVPFTESFEPDTTAAIFWLKNRRPEQYRANPEPQETDQKTTKLEIEVVGGNVNSKD